MRRLHDQSDSEQENSVLNTGFIAEESKQIFSDHESIMSEIQSLSSIPRLYNSQASWLSEYSNDFTLEESEESEVSVPSRKRKRTTLL